MKNLRIRLVVIFAALSILAGVVSFAARSSRGQSPQQKGEAAQKSETRVKPTVLVTERAAPAKEAVPPKEKAWSAFTAAAAGNNTLQNDLLWTFGGKQQHGWYLYNLLIGRSLNTQGSADSTDFAAALATWQKTKGLNADGLLNEDSFMAMVSDWQGRRLKNRNYADPSELITAPPSDFYDPERLSELRQVERATYAAYKQMIAAAIADPTLKLEHTDSGELAPSEKYFKIVSAFRSREYQEQLRKQSPNAGSAGLAMNSPHFTGRALDLYVGGDPVDTKDSNRAIQVKTPAYEWLVRNAERFGFRPYFYEPWHWEYVK